MTKPQPSLGHPKNGRPFNADMRAQFLGLIREGASIRQGAALVGVSRFTIQTWLRSGRAGANAVHRKFAEAFEEAKAVGTHEVVKYLRVHAATDYRAALAILAVADERFGERKLKRKILVLQAERAKYENERLATLNELAKQQARFYAARAGALERVTAGEGLSLIVGVEELLDNPKVSPELKRLLSAELAANNFAVFEARDLGAEPESAMALGASAWQPPGLPIASTEVGA